MSSLHRSVLNRLLVLVAVSLLAGATLGQQSSVNLSQRVVGAAEQFLKSLDDSQRDLAQYEFSDEERLNWHFIPRERNGLPLKTLNQQQRTFANYLLQSLLSAEGYAKSEFIRDLESVLATIEQNGRFVRDPDLYYLTVFGTPSLDSDWAFRYEGHHQAFNWTFIGGVGIASTPQFFGTNPAEVRDGPRQGLRVLATEEDLARSLVKSLSAEQAGVAILRGDAPNDIFTGAEKQVSALADEGIRYSALNNRQRQLLVSLIEEVANTQADGIAKERMELIREQGLEQIQFAWIGSTEPGDAHYYRVQGPGFLIEYDNTQNNANHVHLVWRDFEGDFGRDLIRLHYEAVAVEHGHDNGHQH